jgi:hypothetical protein
LFSQFKLNRATGFLLHDHGSLSDVSGHCNITDPQGHQITTAELAVNGQVKQCKVTPLPSIWSRIRMAQTALGLSGGFWPSSLPLWWVSGA